MAHTYYSPRRVRRHSVSDVPDRTATDEELAGDLEQSIFIFPSPSVSLRTGEHADPLSPLSIPTDASFPTTIETDNTTEGRGRRTSSVSGVSEWATMSLSGRSVSVDTSLRSPLVEVWEMSDEAESEDAAPGRAPMPMYAVDSTPSRQQRHPLGTRSFRSQFVFSDGRFHLRARKESSISPISSEKNLSGATRSSPQDLPAHKTGVTHLPLLEFFSSLLSVDETTLQLLTRPAQPRASPLFPGTRLDGDIDSDNAILDEKRALFALSETASLKAGIEVAVASDPSKSQTAESQSMFALPLPLPVPPIPLAYFVDLVKGLCAASVTVPRKMRLVASARAA